MIIVLVAFLSWQILSLQLALGTLEESVPIALLLSTAVTGATAAGLIGYRGLSRSDPFEPELRWQALHLGTVIIILAGNCLQLWIGDWFAEVLATLWADWADARAFVKVSMATLSVTATVGVAFFSGVRTIWWWTVLEELQRKRPALRKWGDRLNRRREATAADLVSGAASL
ncbi:hypothetical protein PV761_14035 [Arthrobacter sp. CC3]|uniref:hypothetical protein n=1 Tax=Arthrobacter sp. CC3 TaxID=3029185 RepID=UPI003265364C